MKTFRCKIEREKKNKFKRIAFNSIKWATEGLIIVTTCAVMSAGITNNIYGDEKMSSITRDKSSLTNVAVSKVEEEKSQNLKGDFFTAFSGFQELNNKSEGPRLLNEPTAEVIKSFTTENQNGEKVITAETIMDRINGNEYIKGKVDSRRIKRIIETVFKDGIPAERIDMRTNNAENAIFIYAVALSTINDDSEIEGIVRKGEIGLNLETRESFDGKNGRYAHMLHTLHRELNIMEKEVLPATDIEKNVPEGRRRSVRWGDAEVTFNDGFLPANNLGDKGTKHFINEGLLNEDGMYDVRSHKQIDKILNKINDELRQHQDAEYRNALQRDKKNLEKLKANMERTFKVDAGIEIAYTIDREGYTVILAANYGGNVNIKGIEGESGWDKFKRISNAGVDATIAWNIGDSGFGYAGLGFGYDGSQIYSLMPSAKMGFGFSHNIGDTGSSVSYTIFGLNYTMGIYKGSEDVYLKHTFTTSTGAKFTYFTPKTDTEFSTSMYLLFGTSVQKFGNEKHIELAPGIFIEQDFHYVSFGTGAQVDVKTGDVKTNLGVTANLTNIFKEFIELPPGFPEVRLVFNFEHDPRGRR